MLGIWKGLLSTWTKWRYLRYKSLELLLYESFFLLVRRQRVFVNTTKGNLLCIIGMSGVPKHWSIWQHCMLLARDRSRIERQMQRGTVYRHYWQRWFTVHMYCLFRFSGVGPRLLCKIGIYARRDQPCTIPRARDLITLFVHSSFFYHPLSFFFSLQARENNQRMSFFLNIYLFNDSSLYVQNLRL